MPGLRHDRRPRRREVGEVVSLHERIPTTTPDECDRLQAKGWHVSECRPVIECNGYLGPRDTYTCPCWCHREAAA